LYVEQYLKAIRSGKTRVEAAETARSKMDEEYPRNSQAEEYFLTTHIVFRLQTIKDEIESTPYSR